MSSQEKSVVVSQEQWQLVRSYFKDRATVDQQAQTLLDSIDSAWLHPFGDFEVDAALMNDNKRSLKGRSDLDVSASLLAQLMEARS